MRTMKRPMHAIKRDDGEFDLYEIEPHVMVGDGLLDLIESGIDEGAHFGVRLGKISLMMILKQS